VEEEGSGLRGFASRISDLGIRALLRPGPKGRQGEREQGLGAGTIERSVGGSWGSGILSERGRFHEGRNMGNGLGDDTADLPAGETLGTGDVKQAVSAEVGQLPNGAGGAGRRERTAEFVGEKPESAALTPGGEHLLVETAVAGGGASGIERGADHGMPRVAEDEAFRLGLGFAVDAERVGSIGLVVGTAASVEHQVRGEKHEGDIAGESRQVRGGVAVDAACERGLFLAFGTAAESGAVEDESGFLALQQPFNGREVQQVQFVSIEGARCPAGRRKVRRMKEVMPDQAGGTGDPHERG